MRKLLNISLLALLIAASSSCEKGIIFDQDMVIGEWKSHEFYDHPHVWKWKFTYDSVKIYRDSIGFSDSLIYEASGWNTGTFDINLFEDVNPVDSVGAFNGYIYISKNDRDYLVIKSETTNYSFSLSRTK